MNIELLLDNKKIDIHYHDNMSDMNEVFIFDINEFVPLTFINKVYMLAHTIYIHRFSLTVGGSEDVELQVSEPHAGPKDYAIFNKTSYTISRIQRVLKCSGIIERKEEASMAGITIPQEMELNKIALLQNVNKYSNKLIDLIKTSRVWHKSLGLPFQLMTEKNWLKSLCENDIIKLIDFPSSKKAENAKVSVE